MKPRWNKIVIGIGVAFLILIALFFVGRNSLLHYFLDKKLAKFSEHYHTKILVEQASFKGLNGLLLESITVAPSLSDTLIHVDTLFSNIRIFPLLMGKIRFSNLEISNSSVHIIRKKTRDNFSFLLKNKSEKRDSTIIEKRDYSLLAESLLSSVFDAIPASVNLKNSSIKIETDSLQLTTKIPQFSVNNHLFHSQINFSENEKTQHWLVEGSIYSSDRKADIKIFSGDTVHSEIPILNQKWKLKIGFDTLRMKLSEMDYREDKLQLTGSVSSDNLQLNHWRISPNDVVIKKQNIDFSIRVGSNFLQVDSTTLVTYNKVSYHPFLKFQLYPVKQFELDANLAECDGQDFFDSFPTGLFSTLDGIKTKGKLFYRLHFFIDTQHPDDLQFSSYLGKNNFKITGFGNTPLTKINSEFNFTAYDKDRPIRNFNIGPSNPNYTPIQSISTYLKASVLTSEDGNFYSHSGFNEDAFRKSIATNFKEKRFVRGGSTISMQLVKNVFLTRNKTVARKMEEALDVWLIESNRLASKERMYEVYLNLIEWGPNVYGIGEASRFYFDKPASELTLAESIYLAMIIPRPKWFKYNFDVNGKLKESTASYYSVIAGHLLKKGIITEDEANALQPNVVLKGAAKKFILVNDSIAIPHTDVDEDI